jgi:hypothetical protein
MKSPFDSVILETPSEHRTYTPDEILQGHLGPKAVSSGRVKMESAKIQRGAEKEEDVKVYEKRRQFIYGGNLTLVYCSNWQKFLTKHKLSHQENQIVSWLLNNCLYYNFVQITPKDIIEQLGITGAVVSTAMKKFTEIGLIRKCWDSEIPDFLAHGKARWFQLNADLFWRGETHERASAPEGYKIGNRLKDLEAPSLEKAFLKSKGQNRGR